MLSHQNNKSQCLQDRISSNPRPESPPCDDCEDQFLPIDLESKEESLEILDESKIAEIHEVELIEELCVGSTSTIFLGALCKNSKKKPIVIKKIHRFGTNMETLARHEIDVLKLCNGSKFTCKFYYSEINLRDVTLALEYCSGGDLFTLMSNMNIPMDDVRIYCAEIASALNFIHSRGVVFRDIKPENIGISSRGHLRLLDFGSAHVFREFEYDKKEKRYGVVSNCGTLLYAAPEILKRLEHQYEVDWWALGILLYEMVYDVSPFAEEVEDDDRVCNNIVTLAPYFDFEEIPENDPVVDLITRLLEKSQLERWGYRVEDFEEHFQKHPFFQQLCWSDLEAETLIVSVAPELESSFDSCNFPDRKAIM